MQIYPTGKAVNGPLLAEQIAGAGIPGLLRVQQRREVNNSLTGEAVFQDALDGAQVSQLGTIIANHDANGLTAAQQTSAAATTAEAQADAADDVDRATFPALRTQMNNAEAALNTFVARPNPTAANLATLNLVWDAVNLICRIQLAQIKLWRYVITRGIRKGWL